MPLTVRRARWRTPAAVALAVALVVSACGDSDDPAATDDATTTTSTPTTSAPTPTSGDDATTSTTAGDAATGPEEVAAFDGFSVWLDDTGSYLLRLDETWVPQDDGTVTTPGGDGPVRLVVDGTPTRLVMAEWTDLGTLAEGERELTLELLDDQGEPVSDGGTAGTVTVEATNDAPHTHDDDGAEWAEPPSLSIELSEVPTGGWMIRSGTSNFTFAPEHVGAASVEGEGHLHLEVDGEKVGRVYGELHHLPALEPGNHEIELAMTTNDLSPVTVGGEPVRGAVTVVVNDDVAADNPYLVAVGGASTTTAEATTTTAAPDADYVFDVAFVRGTPVGGVQRVPVELGSSVVITVTGDVDDELHLHGYDIETELVANQPATISFTADLPGVWELEAHGNGGVPLLELEVS